MKPQTLHGLLVIDKPGGMTSRAVVNRLQQCLPRGTRIGHTGTLDPLATGVLVLCLGAATRLAEYVQLMSKDYRAAIRLGARSDTDDADGTVTPTDLEHIPTAAEVASALGDFIGEIDQLPPDYSAAKVTGRRAYDLARRGQTVTLAARKITIYAIDLVSYQFPLLEIEVHCGKGTYIRSLARDLGEKLGCGALIETLRRTRVGPFTVEKALALNSLDDPCPAIHTALLPLAAAAAELPRVIIDAQAANDLLQGKSVTCSGAFAIDAAGNSGPCAALDQGGRLVAIGKWHAATNNFSPEKVIVVNP